MSKDESPLDTEIDVQKIMEKIKQDAIRRSCGPNHKTISKQKESQHNILLREETCLWGVLRNINLGLQKTPLNPLILFLGPGFMKIFSSLKYKKELNVQELLKLDDVDFVKNTYILLLKRDPDENGMTYFLNQLRGGHMDKIQIIRTIRYSREGIKINVKINGLNPQTTQLDRLYHIPLVGYIIESFIILIMLPKRIGHFQRFESFMLARNDEVMAELKWLKVALNEKPDVRTYRKMKKLLDTLSDEMPDSFYLPFENKFRGSSEEIKRRVRIYLPYIENARVKTNDLPVLDLGCGRGEWLQLLKENGTTARGVDMNKLMVNHCKELKLDVVHSDAISYLNKQKSNTLGAITGFHIIEHMSLKNLIRLLEESHRVLNRGGVIILESPNPQNLIVGACNFYTDPTHRKPIPPQTLIFLLETLGFSKIEEKKQLFEKVPLSDSILSDFYNSNINIAPDYAIIARKE